jgi:hypothetical protein
VVEIPAGRRIKTGEHDFQDHFLVTSLFFPLVAFPSYQNTLKSQVYSENNPKYSPVFNPLFKGCQWPLRG